MEQVPKSVMTIKRINQKPEHHYSDHEREKERMDRLERSRDGSNRREEERVKDQAQPELLKQQTTTVCVSVTTMVTTTTTAS